MFVVKPADTLKLDHPPLLRSLDRSRVRGVLPQRQMRSRCVAIVDVRSQDSLQMSFADNDHVI